MGKDRNVILKKQNTDLWEFHISNNGDLIYSMAVNGTDFGKGIVIEPDVEEFHADVGTDGTIHLICTNKKGELKYLEWMDTKWNLKHAYNFSGKGYLISNISIFIVDGCINILCILQRKGHSGIGTVCNIKWENSKFIIYGISNVALTPDIISYYQLDVADKNTILVFVNNIGNRAVFNKCGYGDYTFGPVTRVLELKSNCLDFSMERYDGGLNLLCLSKSVSGYLLEHICLSSQETKISTAIFRSNLKVSDSLFISADGILWAFWIAGGKIFYSNFSGNWLKAVELGIKAGPKIKSYHYIEQDEDGGIRTQRVLGTSLPNINLLLPPKKNSESIAGTKDKHEAPKNDNIEPIGQSLGYKGIGSLASVKGRPGEYKKLNVRPGKG